MKSTFKTITESDVMTPAGTPQSISGKEIEITRFNIEAYLPDKSKNPPAVRLLFYLKSGEVYEMLLLGRATKVQNATDTEAVRKETGSVS